MSTQAPPAAVVPANEHREIVRRTLVDLEQGRLPEIFVVLPVTEGEGPALVDETEGHHLLRLFAMEGPPGGFVGLSAPEEPPDSKMDDLSPF